MSLRLIFGPVSFVDVSSGANECAGSPEFVGILTELKDGTDKSCGKFHKTFFGNLRHHRRITLRFDSGYADRGIVYAEISFMKLIPGACIIKVVTDVIYGFCNKLECLSINTRLSWIGWPGTNTLTYYGNHKLRP